MELDDANKVCFLRVVVIFLFTQFVMAAGAGTHGNIATELLSDAYSKSQPEHAIKTTAPAQSPMLLTRQLANQANLEEIDAAVRNHVKTRVIVQVKASDDLERIVNGLELTPTRVVDAFLNSTQVLYHIRSSGMSVSRRYDFIPFFAAEIDANGLQMLSAHPDIVSIEPDQASRMFLGYSVPKVIGQANPWTTKYDGNNSWVAVLDTGVDVSHPMFAGKQILEACFTTYKSCPNGQNRQIGPGAAVPARPGNPNRYKYDHGTHVAGIAVGNYIPSLRFGGVAHNANLIAIRIFEKDRYNPNFYVAYRSSVLAALNYVNKLAATRRVAAANLSFGEIFGDSNLEPSYCDYSSEAITAAMRSLRLRRVASVVAAEGKVWFPGQGDEPIQRMSFPSCISHAVSVINGNKKAHTLSGMYQTDARTLSVSIVAPGTDIRSAVPGGGYAVMSGASMAAPHVSGLFAILREHRPNATVAAMESALDNSGRNIGSDYFSVMWPKAVKALDNIGGHPDRVVLGFNVPDSLKRMQDYGHGSWKINSGTFHGGSGVAFSSGSNPGLGLPWGVQNPHSLMLPRTHFNGSIAAKIRRIGGNGGGANCLDVRSTKARQFRDAYSSRGYRFCYNNSGSAYVRLMGNGPYPYTRTVVCPEQAFAAIRPNDWNILLTTTGAKYVKFYINGSLLCQYENKTVIYGRPGVSFFNVIDPSMYLLDWFYTKVSGTNDQQHEL